MKDIIRRLQKDGEYHFEEMTREESKKAAQALVEAAQVDAEKNGTTWFYYLSMRDVFGYYYVVAVSTR